MASLKKNLHVFCEKPPGRNVQDIIAVRKTEAVHPHLKLKFGFNHRYHDSVREALRILNSGDLGTLINMRGVYGKSAIVGRDNSWRSQRNIAGGGILLDQGIHMLDLMIAFAGPFTEVKSFVTNSYWNHDVEDNAYALMKTATGIVGMLHSTATQWRHRFSLELFLTQGALILSGILSGTKSYGQETLTVITRGANDAGNPKESISNYIEDNSWRDEVFEFAEAILTDQPIRIGSSLDALQAMSHVFKIYSADDQWRTKFNIPSIT
jgi:predicted dehydrogenase